MKNPITNQEYALWVNSQGNYVWNNNVTLVSKKSSLSEYLGDTLIT